MLLFTLPLLGVRETAALSPDMLAPETGPGAIQVNLWARTMLTAGYPLPLFLLIPPAFAWFVRCGLRRGEARHRDLSLHLFLATRPLTTVQMVLPKLKQAALSTLMAWGVTLLFVGFWMLLPAREGQREGPLGLMLLPYLGEREWLLAFVALLGFGFWTWRNQVLGLFVDLSGSPRLVYGVPIATAVFVALAPNLLRSDRFDFMTFLEWALPIALAGKAMAAAWVFRKLLQERVMSSQAMFRLVLGWLIVAACILTFAALVREPLSSYGRFLGFGPSTPSAFQVDLMLLLFLPLVRLAAAPLCLHRNRCR